MAVSSADKIAIYLIQTPPSGRSLNKSEKEKIATYMAKSDTERAAIEMEHLGYVVTAGGAAPTTPPTTPTTPTTPTAPTTPTTPTAPTTPSAAEVPRDSPSGQYVLVFAGGQTHTITAASYAEAARQASSWGIGVVDVYPVPKGYYPSAVEEFLDYWAFIRTPEGQMYPQPQSIEDYFEDVRDRALEFRDTGVLPPAPPTPEEEAEWTPEQIREYNAWRDWAGYREPGDWMANDIADFYANYDQAQKQLTIWQDRAGVAEQERAEAEEYTEEQRAYQEYVRKEAFTEPARLSETFTGWMERERGMSQAFRGFVESEYPSLRSEFEAGQPRPVGYPTREAARAEAARRERALAGWLPEQVPELWQEYAFQRPAQRGERLYMQAPSVRELNYSGW